MIILNDGIASQLWTAYRASVTKISVSRLLPQSQQKCFGLALVMSISFELLVT
jgi:hypothetical protein